MDIAYFRLLFDYNHWANELILNRAAELTHEQFTEKLPGLSLGSIAGALGHQLGTEVIWLSRCHGEGPTKILSDKDFPTLAAMRERWQKQDNDQAVYLSSLTDEDINRVVTYRTMGGTEQKQRLGHMLGHIVNHGTQFRAEAAVGLTAKGHSPGDIDLIVYLRNQRVV
jgi:uncharacterized damage-inducible protein DinB